MSDFRIELLTMLTKYEDYPSQWNGEEDEALEENESLY